MTGPISILIVNWRSKAYLRRCLQTVQDTTAGLVGQIVVVDGGSFDGCGEMLAAEFPAVEFVQSPENVGFGRSNNLGFEHVRQPVLLLLNPDTELKPGALARMLETLEANPRAGILCPRLLNTDGSLQRTSVMAFPTPLNQALRTDFLLNLWPDSRLWGSGPAYASREPIEVEAVSGACMLLRTELFRRLGGFRPEYFMYAEDLDLCLRAHRLGHANMHVPGAEVVHHGGGSSRTQASQFSTVMMRTANETYMRLNHGHAAARHYRATQTVVSLLRLLVLSPACCLVGTPWQVRAKAAWLKSWFVLRWAST